MYTLITHSLKKSLNAHSNKKRIKQGFGTNLINVVCLVNATNKGTACNYPLLLDVVMLNPVDIYSKNNMTTNIEWNFKKWFPQPGFDPRPPAFRACALSAELQGNHKFESHYYRMREMKPGN